MALFRLFPHFVNTTKKYELFDQIFAKPVLLVKSLQLGYQLSVAHLFSETIPDNVRLQFSELSGGSVDLIMDKESGIAKITLNHPEKKNALSGKMIVDLVEIISELEKWKSGKGLFLHGTSHTFCSGGDLKTVRALGNSISGEKMSSVMQTTLTKLLNLPLLSVAFVEGLALGGGAELTTACDFRLMSSTAKIGFVQVKMGVISGWGGGTRLVNLVGRGTALELFSTGKILNAESALKLGLVDHVIGDNTDPVSEAMEWLKKRCDGDILLRQSIKAMVSYASTEYFHSSLNHERQLFSKLWGGPVFQEALNKNIKHKS